MLKNAQKPHYKRAKCSAINNRQTESHFNQAFVSVVTRIHTHTCNTIAFKIYDDNNFARINKCYLSPASKQENMKQPCYSSRYHSSPLLPKAHSHSLTACAFTCASIPFVLLNVWLCKSTVRFANAASKAGELVNVWVCARHYNIILTFLFFIRRLSVLFMVIALENLNSFSLKKHSFGLFDFVFFFALFSSRLV